MSAVKTYSSAPVNTNAARHDGSTPSPEPATTMESSEPTVPPQAATSTETEPADSTSSNHPSPAAQPGAAPSQPAETSTPASIHTPTYPEAATPMTRTQPPKPVSRPEHPTDAAANLLPGVAPPPKAGQVPKPVSAQTQSQSQTPTQPAPASRSGSGPGSASGSGSGIPAYIQSYSFPGSQPPNSTSSPYHSVYPTSVGRPQLPVHGGASGSGGGADSIFPAEEKEGIIGTAKEWMRWGGGKLLEVEKEVWKKINDVHDK